MSFLFFYLLARRWECGAPPGTASKKPVSLEPDLEQERSRALAEVVQIKVTVKVNRPAMLTTGLTFPSQTEMDPNVIQVDVAFLSYTEEGEHNGNARLDSISYVTLRELMAHEVAKRKKKAEMGKNAYKHFKWVSVSGFPCQSYL